MLSVRSLYTEYANERGAVGQGRAGRLVRGAGGQAVHAARARRAAARPRRCARSPGWSGRPSGEIEVGGRVVYSSSKGIFVAPNKRNFGMVFQSYAIWPHMNVFQNVAFPLEVGAQLPRKEIRDKVMRVLTAVQLDDLADREATKLSGGQQQRLALARALVMEPQLLLLDEPLSNLDAKLRERMRFELKRLQRELGLTTVYVTHDQSEALALSHEIAVMNEGRVVQIGTPRADLRAADATSSSPISSARTNFIGGTVETVDGRRAASCARRIGELKAHAGEGVSRNMTRDRLGAARGRGTVREAAARPPMATTSTKARSAPRISSATIWISRSRSAMLCCRRGRIRRCARRPAIRSMCG